MKYIPSNSEAPSGLARTKVFCLSFILSLCSYSLQAQQEDPAFSDPAAVASRLTAVQAELATAASKTNSSQLDLLQELEASILMHQEAISFHEEVKAQAAQAASAATDWQGFEQAPPYTMSFVDQIRSTLRGFDRRKTVIDSRLRLINHRLEDTTLKLNEHLRKSRQLREAASSSTDATMRGDALAAAAQEDLNARISAEIVARLQLRKNSHEMMLLTIDKGIELANRKVAATRGQVIFASEELNRYLAAIDAERATLTDTSADSTDSSDSVGNQSSWKLEYLLLEKDFWVQLFAAMNSKSKSDRKAAFDNIRGIVATANEWTEVLSLQVRDAAETGLQDIGLLVTPDDFSRVLRLQDRAEFSLRELSSEGVQGSEIYDQVIATLLSVWGLELYLAEDTELVGGQKVTVVSAVTLGKLVRLVFILVVGWYLLKLLSQLVQRLVAKRENVLQDTVDAAGSWTFGVGLTVLIVFGLNRVHIPFTAFAFLGGTLAIGIGFGAQTLLKNFISGIILSLERPFRVGDLVQVEDITGRIRKIGLRASVIRHLDGVDTLVPNSSLLENRVSNWTFGDSTLRGEILVGVAYGSPTREVTRCLLTVAEQHGLVVKPPKPEVRFADFGDNALVFRLLFWFDANKVQCEPLASDLRYMIEGAFAEAGIVMAFPQRDLHFDNDEPLRIEFSKPEQRTGSQTGLKSEPSV